MKKVTRYISDDGLEFTTEQSARAQDELAGRVLIVEARILGPRVTHEDWPSSRLGYVQHSVGTRGRLLSALDDLGLHSDTVGALGRLGTRFDCLDINNREHGQVYWANHPDESSCKEMFEDRRY